MFILVDGKQSPCNAKSLLVWLCITGFCGVFSAVYEYFSHGVVSPFMVWLFAFPLIGGVLPTAIFTFSRLAVPHKQVRDAWRAGIATLSVGSCMTGIFEIYGSASPLVALYWFVGLLWIVGSGIVFLFSCYRNKR